MSAFDLLSAASVGDLQLLQQLLDGGLSPEASTPAGWTALHAAAMAGQVKAMQLLIQRGAPAEARTLQGGHVPLHSAARVGQTSSMQLLLDAKAGVDAADHKGYHPLFHAIVDGHVDSVQVLLDAGADASGLFLSAVCRGHHQIVCFLISRGANANERTKCVDQLSALHFAAWWGHIQTVQELLAAGADVSAVASTCRVTALYLAAEDGHDGVVQLLLDNGADADAATASGSTALHVAAQCGHAKVAKLLLSAGANVASRDAAGFTPLHIAAAKGYAAIACKLVAAGADLYSVTYHRRLTPLMVAADFGQLEAVQVLVASGADSQQALVDAARKAAGKRHMATWAFLARKVQGMYPQDLWRCVAVMDAVAATRAMAVGWAGEVDRQEENLEAAKRERAEGEVASQEAQQLIVQTALMQKQLERSTADRKQVELLELKSSVSKREMGRWCSWKCIYWASLGACIVGSTYLWCSSSRSKWKLHLKLHSPKGS
jgi:ankyrin repeat protein